MNIFLLVFLGGGLGSVSRYLISLVFIRLEFLSLPWATLSSNLLSAAILGTFIWKVNPEEGSILYPLIAIGFCGGFSTFSTFSMETLELLKQGETTWAVLNVMFSVVLCLFVLYALYKLMR